MTSSVLQNLGYRDGTLVAKRSTGRKRAGEAVGYICRTTGYVRLRNGSRNHYVHRLVWEMFHGSIPTGLQIDHINGVRSDNRIENLRVVTQQANLKNARLRESNLIGITGLTEMPSGRIRARIGDKGTTIYLGMFSSKQAAIRARKEAEAKLGYHTNHGRHCNAADHT